MKSESGRAAYDWSAETTIYIQKDARKMGAGRKLYVMLEQISRAQNITNLYACIGYPFFPAGLEILSICYKPRGRSLGAFSRKKSSYPILAFRISRACVMMAAWSTAMTPPSVTLYFFSRIRFPLSFFWIQAFVRIPFSSFSRLSM